MINEPTNFEIATRLYKKESQDNKYIRMLLKMKDRRISHLRKEIHTLTESQKKLENELHAALKALNERNKNDLGRIN